MATADMDEGTAMCAEKARAAADDIIGCWERTRAGTSGDEGKDLTEYLDDAYGYLGTLKGEACAQYIDEPERFSLMLGCGGPNIWLVLDGASVAVEVCWGCSEYIITLCSRVSDGEMFGAIEEWFVGAWHDALEAYIADAVKGRRY